MEEGTARKRKRIPTTTELMKVTPQLGYDIFVSQNYDAAAVAQDGHDHVFSKRKVVDSKWQSLTQQQKDIFKSAASERNEANANQCANEELPDFFKWSERIGAYSGKRNSMNNYASYTSRRTRAVQRTLNKMISHPIFDHSIHDFDAGFKSELVCKDLKRSEVRKQLSDICEYDHIPATNL